MRVDVGWYVEKYVVFMRLSGSFDEDTFFAGINAADDLGIRNLDHTVHFLMETLDLQGSLSPRAMGRFPAMPDNFGWIVSASTTNPLARFVGTVVLNALGQNLKLVSDLDEAIATLKRIDPNLSELLDAGHIQITQTLLSNEVQQPRA